MFPVDGECTLRAEPDPRREPGLAPQPALGVVVPFYRSTHRGCMCANPELHSARKASTALRRAGVTLAATIAIVGTNAPASMARATKSSAPSESSSPQPQAEAEAPQPAQDASAPAEPSAPGMYTVVPGDHLTSIAVEHGLDPETGWRVLFDANPSVANPDMIVPGQQLRIPAPGEQVPSRALPQTAPVYEASSSSSSSSSSGSRRGRSTTRSSTPAGDGVWDQLARCESGGNWSHSGGTYDGGLQFHPGTWNAHGGGQYASTADQATREQQIAVAERVRASQGWSAWPACSRKLGLR